MHTATPSPKLHAPAPAPVLALAIARAHGQRGISSLLFLLLSGLSLGAMVFGGIYYVRSLQAQSVTVHALTQAQLKAWSGLEAVRQHLFQLGASEAAKLAPKQAVQFAGMGGISATVVEVLANDASHCSGGTRVGFDITGSSGGANALLAATFCAKGGPGSGGGNSRGAVINIKGNLDLGGDLSVIGGDKARVVVDGKVNGSGSLAGISSLYASDDVTLGGSTQFDMLFSEGHIALSGSGLYSSVQSMKNIVLSGGVGAGTLTANGTVSIESNSVTELNAIGHVQLGSNAKVATLKTRGNVLATNAHISGTASVQGNYEERSAGSVQAGQYGGSLSVQPWNAEVKLSRQPGLSVPLTPLTATAIATPSVDAYAYKAIANYVFERVGNDTKVSVRSVNGIPDGSYFLTGSGDKQDYLCSGSSYSAASCKARICVGYSDYNSCFAYNAGKWTLAGMTMAPGVVWFKGDFEAGQGSYANSWIATGNITTAGNNLTEAVNYAGHAKVCGASSFPDLWPKNFCKPGSSQLLPVSSGNIAFAAGGLVGNVYSGGKIVLGSSNHVYGDVLAGDILETSGSTTVHGYISAARNGLGAGNNKLGASTKIDLSNLPAGFNPGDNLPNSGGALAATLLWSRYR